MSKKVKLKSVTRKQNKEGKSKTKLSQASLRKAEEKARAAEELARKKAEYDEMIRERLLEARNNPPAPESVQAAEPAVEEAPAPEPVKEAPPAPAPAVEEFDDDAVIADDDISEEATERRLRRLSLNTLTRYAKQSAKGADNAILDSQALQKDYDKVLGDIKAAKTPSDATDAEKEELNKKRAELRKERDAIAKKKAIADNKAVSLERAADEYAYVVSLLSKEPPVDYRKQPRINPMNIDLTDEEKAELIARYYNTGKYNTKPAPKAKPAEAPKPEKVETPQVEEKPAEEAPAEQPVEEAAPEMTAVPADENRTEDAPEAQDEPAEVPADDAPVEEAPEANSDSTHYPFREGPEGISGEENESVERLPEEVHEEETSGDQQPLEEEPNVEDSEESEAEDSSAVPGVAAAGAVAAAAVLASSDDQEEAPVEESPVEEAPVEGAPAEEAPVEEAPAEEAPVEEAPVEEAPVEEAPVEEAPAEEAPVEEAPVEEAPVEEAPVEEAPVEEAPVEEAPVEEAPVEEAPVEEAPVEEAPVEEAPVEEAPVEEAPVEEAPVEEAPVEEAPVEEASAEEEPKAAPDVDDFEMSSSFAAALAAAATEDEAGEADNEEIPAARVSNYEEDEDDEGGGGGLKWFILLILLILIILALLYMKFRSREEQIKDDAPVAAAVATSKGSSAASAAKPKEKSAPAEKSVKETAALAPATVPVEEEVKLPAANAENFVETFDTFTYTKIVTIDGYVFAFDVCRGSAVITYPVDITDSYAQSAVSSAAEKYAPYLSEVTVTSLGGGKLELSFPESYDEPTLRYAVDLIAEELTGAVASFCGVPASSIYYFSTSIDTANSTVDVEVCKESLADRKAADIKAEDFGKVVDNLLASYPGTFDGVKYGLLAANKARFYYPSGTSEADVLAGVDIAQKEIALYYNTPAVVANMAERSVESGSRIVFATDLNISFVEKQTFIEKVSTNYFVRSEKFGDSKLVFDTARGKATVTYPAAVSDKDAVEFFAYLSGKYDMSGITIGKIADGKLGVTYPEEFTPDDVHACIDIVMAELNAYIEELAARASVAEEESPKAAEEAPAAPAKAPEAPAAEPEKKAPAKAKAPEVPAAEPAPAKARTREPRYLVSVEAGGGRSTEYDRYLATVDVSFTIENFKGLPVDLIFNSGAFGGPKTGWSEFFKNDMDKAFKFSTYDKGFYAETLIGTHFDAGKMTLTVAAGPRFAVGTDGSLVKDGVMDDVLRRGYTLDIGLTGQAGARYQLTEQFSIGINGYVTYMFKSSDFQFGARAAGIVKF